MEYRWGRFKLVENVRSRIHLQVYEHSPSSHYSCRRYKGPRSCCRLVVKLLFCQNWPNRLQGYEREYILLRGHRHHGSSWSFKLWAERGSVGRLSIERSRDMCWTSVLGDMRHSVTHVVVVVRVWPSYDKHGPPYWLMDTAGPLLPLLEIYKP